MPPLRSQRGEACLQPRDSRPQVLRTRKPAAPTVPQGQPGAGDGCAMLQNGTYFCLPRDKQATAATARMTATTTSRLSEGPSTRTGSGPMLGLGDGSTRGTLRRVHGRRHLPRVEPVVPRKRHELRYNLRVGRRGREHKRQDEKNRQAGRTRQVRPSCSGHRCSGGHDEAGRRSEGDRKPIQREPKR